MVVDSSEFIIKRFDDFLRRQYSKSLNNENHQPEKNNKRKYGLPEEIPQEEIKPFFASLWFHSAHAPFVGTKKYRQIASNEVEKEIAKYGTLYCGSVFDKYNTLQLLRVPCQKKFSVEYCSNMCKSIKVEYYSAILSLDEAIGNAVSLLEKYKLRENTLIIFSSDNGPARFDTSGSGVRYVAPGSTASL